MTRCLPFRLCIFPVLLFSPTPLSGERHPARCQHCTPAVTEITLSIPGQPGTRQNQWLFFEQFTFLLISCLHLLPPLSYPLPYQGHNLMVCKKKMYLYKLNALRGSVVYSLQPFHDQVYLLRLTTEGLKSANGKDVFVI